MSESDLIYAVLRLSLMRKGLDAAMSAHRQANIDLGFALRSYRQHSGHSLRSVARHLKVSAPFLSDCELGRRTLSDKHREAYLNFIEPTRNWKIK